MCVLTKYHKKARVCIRKINMCRREDAAVCCSGPSAWAGTGRAVSAQLNKTSPVKCICFSVQTQPLHSKDGHTR